MSDDLNFTQASYPAPPEYASIQPEDSGPFLKAILFGLVAAIVGCLLYAGFTVLTHIQIGYFGLAVGFLVGKAMMAGSGNRGGRKFQIAAAILTYLSVAMAIVPEAIWGGQVHSINPIKAVIFGVASPFLELADGFGGIIGLIILFVAIRAAWRMTSANSNTAHHPFSAG